MDNRRSERGALVRNRDKLLYLDLEQQLHQFDSKKYKLLGINTQGSFNSFILQLIDSIRRVQYVFTIGRRGVSNSRVDPTSDYFDPIRASVLFKRRGMIDEAFWLVFMSVHFGKALRSGWRLARDIYGCLGQDECWTWERTSSDPEAFKQWLESNYSTLKGDGILRNFGNHRKYETLKSDSTRGTGFVFESYVKWIGPSKSHEELINRIESSVGREPRKIFDYLYKEMDRVISFGRTAKFDYLTMLGKLDLALIEPGLTYMRGSTGPVKGARLLFGGHVNAMIRCTDLEDRLNSLESDLSLGEMGMQVLEDALCNWQKNPHIHKRFHG